MGDRNAVRNENTDIRTEWESLTVSDILMYFQLNQTLYQYILQTWQSVGTWTGEPHRHRFKSQNGRGMDKGHILGVVTVHLLDTVEQGTRPPHCFPNAASAAHSSKY